jgi:ketosteroid isomerase-like protein
VEPRPAAATVIPILLLAVAAGGGWFFQGRQEATGKPVLLAAARDYLTRHDAPRGLVSGITEVDVHGDLGHTVVVTQVSGGPYAPPQARIETYVWRRSADGRWAFEGTDAGPRRLR